MIQATTARSDTLRGRAIEIMAYNGLALAIVASLLYVHYEHPVHYVHLVAEDRLGEFATAVAFSIAGALLILLAARPGPASRRVSWALMALFVIFVAGEEVNWGTRYFRSLLEGPLFDAIRDANLQGQINVHNMHSALFDRLQHVAALALIFWILACLVVAVRAPRFLHALEQWGVPVVPPKLAGFFLAFSYARLLDPVAKSGEVAELFLGLAVAVWALDLYFRHAAPSWFAGRRFGAACGAVATSIIVGGIMGSFAPDRILTVWYNRLAAYDYPALGLFGQAEMLFDYIERNPVHETADTRIEHARLLDMQGRRLELVQRLAPVIGEAEAMEGRDDLDEEVLHRFAVAYQLLADEEQARRLFDRVLEAKRHRLELAADADERAQLLWSLAMTLEELGDRTAALGAAEAGAAEADAARHRREIQRWIERLTPSEAPDVQAN